MITKPMTRPGIGARGVHTNNASTEKRAEFDWFLLVLVLLLTLGVAFIGTIAYIVMLG